jgi:hypothetical protein
MTRIASIRSIVGFLAALTVEVALAPPMERPLVRRTARPG